MQFELDNDPTDPVNIHINSLGGSVTEGIAMIQILKNSKRTINTNIMGIAASMSAVIAMVGEKVTMSDGSILMIHNAHFESGGDADALRTNADLAEALSDTMAKIFAKKTGLGKRVIKEFMDNETRFTAKEALKNGFIDEIVQPLAVAAKFEIKNSITIVTNLFFSYYIEFR